MVEPQSPEVEHVKKLVAQVDSGAALSAQARTEILETFEQFECWAPYFRLLKRCLQDPSTRQLSDYVRLARVQNLYLEDVFAAAETCAAMVVEMKIPYQKFTEEVLPQVIEFEDYSAEATILSAACDRFPEVTDHVQAIERLCMLYEKKTHNETQLGKTYEKLLAIDPRNVKALRYFKLVFTQNNEWEEVVGILRTLITCVKHQQELFRVAQELAAIYLYQLDMAEEAINVLETHCAESPLDTSTILYDAYQRMADWAGCLKVLRQCLLNVDDDSGRAVLHFKIGSLLEQTSDLDGAIENFTKSAKLWPQFLDAVEGIINIGVLKQDWKLVQTWLQTLEGSIQDERLKVQLKQAQRRVQDGLAHAKPG